MFVGRWLGAGQECDACPDRAVFPVAAALCAGHGSSTGAQPSVAQRRKRGGSRNASSFMASGFLTVNLCGALVRCVRSEGVASPLFIGCCGGEKTQKAKAPLCHCKKWCLFCSRVRLPNASCVVHMASVFHPVKMAVSFCHWGCFRFIFALFYFALMLP